jgi:chemotaxis protein CheX
LSITRTSNDRRRNPVQFDHDTIASLATDIWSSMLGIDLASGGSHDRDGQVHTFTACVQITGDWAGAVTLSCELAAANHFAATMFGMEPDELASDEVRDALGELCNMTAGGIKGLIDGACQLGIPAVAEGTSYEFTIPKGKITCAVDMSFEGSPVVVSIYETA